MSSSHSDEILVTKNPSSNDEGFFKRLEGYARLSEAKGDI
jgi:hypothetical protein